MITIYAMASCPDCAYLYEQVRGNDNYKLIDIGEHVRHLKAFLRLRDTQDAFVAVRRVGAVGIPCFVLDDGSVTLSAESAGLSPRPAGDGAACSLDGTGC